jgi:hypothetical protein
MPSLMRYSRLKTTRLIPAATRIRAHVAHGEHSTYSVPPSVLIPWRAANATVFASACVALKQPSTLYFLPSSGHDVSTHDRSRCSGEVLEVRR